MAYRRVGMGLGPALVAISNPLISSITAAQAAQRRETKLASNFATAQSRNSLADQSYLMWAQKTGGTRYEYDKLVAPFVTSGTQHAARDVLVGSGLFTDAYINSLVWPDQGGGLFSTAAGLFAPAGSSPGNPAGAGLPPMVLPLMLAAGVALFLTMRH